MDSNNMCTMNAVNNTKKIIKKIDRLIEGKTLSCYGSQIIIAVSFDIYRDFCKSMNIPFGTSIRYKCFPIFAVPQMKKETVIITSDTVDNRLIYLSEVTM